MSLRRSWTGSWPLPRTWDSVPSKQRIPDACCQWNTDYIINKRPEQIFMDIAQGRPAQPDGGRHIQKTALHQHHIRRVNGDIRTRAMAMPMSALVRAGASLMPSPTMAVFPFSFRERITASFPSEARPQSPHPHRPERRCSGCPLIISGEHHHPDAHILQFPAQPGDCPL